MKKITILGDKGKETIPYEEYLEKFFFKFPLFDDKGNPQCRRCGAKFVQARDSITKEISKYTWKGTCKHFPEDIRMCIC